MSKIKVYTHDEAMLIVNEFEELLDRKGITVPCSLESQEKERIENGENDAKLYGTEYSDLLDSVENILMGLLFKYKKDDVDVVNGVFSGNV